MLPTDAKARKDIPIYSGFLRYFPDAIMKVAELSRIGNDQHNPGKPLHWDRSKSGDELDALARHLLDNAADVPADVDGVLHLTKVAWRAMAALQKAVESRSETTTADYNHHLGGYPTAPDRAQKLAAERDSFKRNIAEAVADWRPAGGFTVNPVHDYKSND